MLELAGEGLVHGPAHSSIGQEGGAVGSIVGLRSTDAVNGSHRGHHQFLAKALTHVERRRASTPAARGDPKIQTRAAAHARRDPRARAGLLPRPRRLDAPAVVRGRRAGHERHRRRRRADGRGQRVGAEAQRDDDLTISYFGDGAGKIGSVLETMNLAAAWKLPFCFFIENNLYAVSTRRRRDHRRPAAVGARPGLRHPGLAGRRHGPARRAPRDGGGRRADARRRGARGDRGRGLPLLPPERPLPGQRVRLPRQGRGGPVARPRSARPGGDARWSRSAAHRRGRAWRSVREPGAGGDEGRRAAELVEADPDQAGKRRIRPDLWPDPGFVNVGVRGDASELDDADRARAASSYEGRGVEA